MISVIRKLATRGLLLSLALLSLTITPAVIAAGAEPLVRIPHNASSKTARADLMAPLQSQGEVRIIVGLQTPQEIAQAVDTTPDEIRTQRVAARQERLLERLAGHHVRNIKRLRNHQFLAMTVDGDALNALLVDPEVTSIAEDRLVYPVLYDTPGITHADKAWTQGFRGAGQAVAIIDTGVDKTHAFFNGKVVAEACFSTPGSNSTSYCPNGAAQSTAAGSGTPCPDYGLACWHGTHVAGIATGRTGLLTHTTGGIAPDSNVIAIQAFHRFCSGGSCSIAAYDSDLISALDHVYSLRNTYNVASINMSLGGDLYAASCDASLPAYKKIIDSLRSVNIATVIAAGNNGNAGAITAPGCISSAVSVGSTTKANAISSFSNSASFLSLLAPGSSITSSLPLAYASGGYGTASGTSMATPHVAGAWAVIKSAKPTASVSEVLIALQNTGIPITDSRNGITKSLIRIGDTDAQFGAVGVVLGRNSPPSVVLISPTNGTTFIAPASITVTASATATGHAVSRVEFFQGVTKIGEALASPYSVVWGNVPQGSYTLTARVTDSIGGTAVSAPVNVSVNAPPPPNSTLPAVASWRFEEGSGGVAGDSSGNGNTGTLRNGASWAAGQMGGAIQLNGTTQDVVVADSPSLSITGTGLTLAGWIYPTQAVAAGVIHKDRQYSIFRNANGSITYADSATWSYATIGSYGVTPLNTWSHVAVTFDGSVIRFYVNGQLVGTVNRAGTLTDNTNPIYLGSYAGIGSMFAGKLDEMQVFSRALSAQEIVALQGGGAPATITLQDVARALSSVQ